LRKNNFTELAPKFRLDLVAPIEQTHRNPDSIGISRILRLSRRQRWLEVGMRKCEVVFSQVLSVYPSRAGSSGPAFLSSRVVIPDPGIRPQKLLWYRFYDKIISWLTILVVYLSDSTHPFWEKLRLPLIPPQLLAQISASRYDILFIYSLKITSQIPIMKKWRIDVILAYESSFFLW